VQKKELRHIMIDLYLDESEESKRVEELFKKNSIPYVAHRESSRYDEKLKRPYMTIGNPEGDHFGPSSNIRWIEWIVECLASSPNKIVDPRISTKTL
jgi:hypothetical protein